MKGYVATVRSAALKLPIAVEFEKMFPDQTDHFITHYGLNYPTGDRTNTWNSEAHFENRYSLTMQMEVVVDYEKNTVTRAGPPRFYLVEHYRVEQLEGGRSMSHSRGVAEFGEEQWRNIYDANGDFSVVGIAIRKNEVVPNMADYINAVRSPRYPVSLLGQRATNEGHGGLKDVDSNE